MQNAVIIFIHLSGAALAIGACAFGLLLWPRLFPLDRDGAPPEQAPAYLVMDRLAPTVFVGVLVLVFSGIYFMMENYTDQVNLPDGYYTVLGIKLLFVVTAFFLSAYQTFLLKPEIAHLDLQPERRERVPAVLNRMHRVGQVLLGSLAGALFMGVYLARYGG